MIIDEKIKLTKKRLIINRKTVIVLELPIVSIESLYKMLH